MFGGQDPGPLSGPEGRTARAPVRSQTVSNCSRIAETVRREGAKNMSRPMTRYRGGPLSGPGRCRVGSKSIRVEAPYLQFAAAPPWAGVCTPLKEQSWLLEVRPQFGQRRADQAFTKVSEGLSHGISTIGPPNTIGLGSKVTWELESDGSLTAADGWGRYLRSRELLRTFGSP